MKKLIACTLILLGITVNAQITQTSIDGYLKDLPFGMEPIKLLSYPDKKFDIRDYGARPGGIEDNTRSLQNAIDECSAAGGGYVIVPAGIWLTGPVELKSHVNLHLLSGSLLQFSGDIRNYRLKKTIYEGTLQYRAQSPISAFGAEHIAITGQGIIDGAGDKWRLVKKFKMTEIQWNALLKSGGVVSPDGEEWWPSEEAMNGASLVKTLSLRSPEAPAEEYEKARHYLRPVMVEFTECTDVLLEGPVFQNSPAWNLHPLMCRNVIVSDITVRNPWYSQNGDGIDVESCSGVLICNSRFDVGDDAICIKSGKNEEGRRRGVPAENIVIRDCQVYHGHGGFTIGSEMSGGVRNIFVGGCTFSGTDVGLRFKSARGRGGVVENIYIENIFMKEIAEDAVNFNMIYSNAAPSEDKNAETKYREMSPAGIDDGTPVFRNIRFRNIECLGAGNAVMIQGLPELPVKGLLFENLNITSVKGVSVYYAVDSEFRNTRISAEQPEYSFYQSSAVRLGSISGRDGKTPVLRLSGRAVQAVSVTGAEKERILEGTIYVDGAGRAAAGNE